MGEGGGRIERSVTKIQSQVELSCQQQTWEEGTGDQAIT